MTAVGRGSEPDVAARLERPGDVWALLVNEAAERNHDVVFRVDPRPIRLTTEPVPPSPAGFIEKPELAQRRGLVLDSLGVAQGDVSYIPSGCPPWELFATPVGACPAEWIKTAAYDIPTSLGPDEWSVLELVQTVRPEGYSAEISVVHLTRGANGWVVEWELLMAWGE